MKTASIAIFAIGALMLVMHLFQKLVTGTGSADAEDAMAILVLAGVARIIFQGGTTTTKTG
jgi:hypothetical protein